LFIGLSGYFTAIRKKIPFVFEVRDLWPESVADTGVVKNKMILSFARYLEKFIYRKAKLINVLTPAFRKNLVEKKGVPDSKVCYIPNAADINSANGAMKSFDKSKLRMDLNCLDKFVVVYVGAHGLANGLNQILDTAEKLKDTDVVFWLIGKGMKKNELIASAQQRGINNVMFIDPVPKLEVYKYILAADVGTSVLIKNDTFKTIYSNKTFDYMSCKRPVLLAIDGVSRELVEEADCGLFVEPENSNDFAEKIMTYKNNPELLVQHGKNGFEYVNKHFDRRKLAVEYIDCLAQVIK
jgi:glycosyltransferase involved in cell wall biosynthesis